MWNRHIGKLIVASIVVFCSLPTHAGATFRVEAKAWIPHDRIDDPGENAYRQAYAKVDPCYWSYDSYFPNDDHRGYYGSKDKDYRVIAAVTFEQGYNSADPTTRSTDINKTVRKEECTKWNPWDGSYHWSATHPKQADCCVDNFTVSGNTQNLEFHATNPYTPDWATNDITGIYQIKVDGNQLKISVTHDLFPSYGIEIQRNGQVCDVVVIQDVLDDVGESDFFEINSRLGDHDGSWSKIYNINEEGSLCGPPASTEPPPPCTSRYCIE